MNDFKKFVTHLRLESLSLAILMLTLAIYSTHSAWVLLTSFIVFDIGIVGYAINKKVGAITYNFMHNMTLPTMLIVLGLLVTNETVLMVGYTWIFHISIDRTLGFGLKHKHDFKHTHLGVIGKQREE